jgi:transposase-like protein
MSKTGGMVDCPACSYPVNAKFKSRTCPSCGFTWTDEEDEMSWSEIYGLERIFGVGEDK